MKLFLREHLLLMIVQIVQVCLFGMIIKLDGYQNNLVLIYASLLSILLMSCYLGFMYYSRRAFYERLMNEMILLDKSIEKSSDTPIGNALDDLLKSQYRLYESEIRRVNEQQEEQLLFMDRWVHKMKTPLSVIELTAQTLDEPDSSNIREETERMKIGLNTVLYMARLRTIDKDFQVKPVVLAQLIHEVNQENKRFFIRNKVYPTLREERANITVQTDEKWLFFMVTQLIQNAVKYSSGRSTKLDIALFERNGKAILEVKDYGIGIPKGDQKRIFNKFYTGENGRKYRESTGIGLYLVKEVAAELDHIIEVQSQVDRGTTFRIVFRPSQNITSM